MRAAKKDLCFLMALIAAIQAQLPDSDGDIWVVVKSMWRNNLTEYFA
jgi:hypothetical protein